ncbi:MAG: periplasmic binding protein/LacI transcriptional regulator [Clostridia bacterium]|jgi:ribose transport system substrate-binding protein|nr:periplasmic binding protein/LacI transcriptional regulator [Clostridia bacterium]
MKRPFVVGIILSIVIGFSFASEQKAAPEKKYIPVIVRIKTQPFWQQVKLGAEKAAEDYDVEMTFEGVESELLVNEQPNIFKAALDKNPSSIVLSAVDAKALGPYLEKAQEAGIPVIGLNAGVDSPIVKTTVGIDNYGAGVLAAEKMAELLGYKGEVGLISVDRVNKISIDRRDGFVDTINQRYPNMKVVAVEYGEANANKAEEVTKKLLEDHPNIKGIFGGDREASIGVINAAKEFEKIGDLIIIGFDSSKTLIDTIRDGTVAGAITQRPILMGYEAVRAAYKASEGEKLPEFIDTGFEWYDKSNIDKPYIKDLLYE